jgi:phasin family protein
MLHRSKFHRIEFPDRCKRSEGAIMTTPSQKPATPGTRRTPRLPTTTPLAVVVDAVAPQVISPAPVPVETVKPAAVAPDEPIERVEPSVQNQPSEQKLTPKPSQPLTSMVSFMTATPTFKGYEEIAAFGKANIDALIQANTVFTKGIETISKEVFTLTQSQFESAAAGAKAIFAARTLKDFVELNTDLTKAHFDKLVAHSTKLGELSAKVATDTFAPISARVTSVVEKAAKPSA